MSTTKLIIYLTAVWFTGMVTLKLASSLILGVL